MLLLHCLYTIGILHRVTFLIAHLGWSHARMLRLWNGFLFHGMLECTVIFPPLNCFTYGFSSSLNLNPFFYSKSVPLLWGGWCKAAKCHQHSCIFKYQGTLQLPAVLAAFILRGKKGDRLHIAAKFGIVINTSDTWLIFVVKHKLCVGEGEQADLQTNGHFMLSSLATPGCCAALVWIWVLLGQLPDDGVINYSSLPPAFYLSLSLPAVLMKGNE